MAINDVQYGSMFRWTLTARRISLGCLVFSCDRPSIEQLELLLPVLFCMCHVCWRWLVDTKCNSAKWVWHIRPHFNVPVIVFGHIQYIAPSAQSTSQVSSGERENWLGSVFVNELGACCQNLLISPMCENVNVLTCHRLMRNVLLIS